MNNALVVFHRCGGKSLGYPPNNTITLKWAIEFGANAVEYDILACKDGDTNQIIVIEPKLLKQAGLDINNLTLSEVKKIDVGNEQYGHANPALLEDFFSIIAGKKISQQIHIKGNNLETTTALLPKLEGVSNYILTSFDLEVIRQIKSENKDISVGWIVKPQQESGNEGLEDLTAKISNNEASLPAYSDEELNDIIAKAKNNQVNIVLLCGPRIKDKGVIEKIRAAALGVGAWGIGSNVTLAKQLIEFRIDRFTIDNPEQL